MTIDPAGLLVGARFVASPNCDDRPPGTEVTLLVVHNVSLPPGAFGGDDVIRLFTNTLDCAAHPYYEALQEVRVSAHFLIRRTGEIIQFVPCDRRAWHAGVSHWRGRERCNDFSIGVELEGTDTRPYTVRQYRRLGRLAVARSASGRGVGAELLAAASAIARERGSAYIRLECPAENERLCRYYVGLGFSHCGDNDLPGPNGEAWVSSVFERPTDPEAD